MNKKLLTITLFAVCLSPILNANQPDYASIRFCEKASAEDLMVEGFTKLLTLHQRVSHMRDLTVQALNDSNSSEEKLKLDSQYQHALNVFNQKFKKIPSLHMYQNNDDCMLISFGTNSDEQTSMYRIYHFNTDFFNIENINLNNLVDAKIADEAIEKAIKWVESYPDVSDEAKQIKKTQGHHQGSYLLILNDKNDARRLNQNFSTLKQKLLVQLYKMRELSKHVITGKIPANNDANIELRHMQASFNQIIENANFLKGIQIFNNQTLAHEQTSYYQPYRFVKLTLNDFGFEGTSIVTTNEAFNTLNTIEAADNYLKDIMFPQM